MKVSSEQHLLALIKNFINKWGRAAELYQSQVMQNFNKSMRSSIENIDQQDQNLVHEEDHDIDNTNVKN